MIIPAYFSCSSKKDGGGDKGGEKGGDADEIDELDLVVGETSIDLAQRESDAPLNEDEDNVPVDRVPPGDDGRVYC